MAFSPEKRRELSTQPVGKLLMRFALPSIVSMCITSVYNLCDTFFIGQTVGALAIAGLAIVFPLMNIGTAFRLLVSVGGASQVSLYMGRDDQEGASRIYSNMMGMSLLVGLALMIGGLLFLDPILSLFGASSATLPFARDYMFIYLHGLPFAYLFFAMTSQLRAVGHPRTSMTILIGSVLLNIVLDAIFVLQLHWGIRGAAYATVFSQIAGFVASTIYFRFTEFHLHFTFKSLRLSMSVIKRILSIGVSPFSIQVSGCIIVLIINRSLMGYGGADGDLFIGAYGIMYRISQMMILIVSGFAQGMQPLVGVNAGAGLFDRVRHLLTYSICISTVVMVLGYLAILIWAEEIAFLLTDDPHLVACCAPAMRIALCIYPLVGSQMIATSYFNSVGHARLSMITSLSRMWIFLLPLLLFLPRLLGLEGVWWSMSLADCASVLLAWILLWREIRATQ